MDYIVTNIILMSFILSANAYFLNTLLRADYVKRFVITTFFLLSNPLK